MENLDNFKGYEVEAKLNKLNNIIDDVKNSIMKFNCIKPFKFDENDDNNAIRIRQLLSEIHTMFQINTVPVKDKYTLIIKDYVHYAKLYLNLDWDSFFNKEELEKYFGTKREEKDKIDDILSNDYKYMKTMDEIFNHLRIPKHAVHGYIISEKEMFSDIIDVEIKKH